MNNKQTAVILLSGGLDSATVLAVAIRDGFRCIPLTFNYGQRHDVELAAAQEVARSMGCTPPIIAALDLRVVGASALTSDISVPKGRDPGKMAQEVPVTYVPARNLLFLSYAAALAEARGATDLFIGVNALDYSGYPDCREEFIRAFELAVNLGTKTGSEGRRFTVHTPLIELSKAEIVALGTSLGVDYSLTHSCYDPEGELACGRCDACLLRSAGFEKAGIDDPTRYAPAGR